MSRASTRASFDTPGPFDFKRPNEWPKWKRRFIQYLTATGLDKEDGPRRVCTLLYCMGEDAEDVLASTDTKEDEKADYKIVLDKFDAYFKIRRNIIFERAKFNRRDQAEGESAEQYIACLYNLVETCEYGALKEEMLRDRIVVGIRDKALSDKLQMDESLSLEKAKTQVRQKEAVKEQRHELQESSLIANVKQGQAKKRHQHGQQTRHRKGKWPQQERQKGAISSPQYNRCKKCGKGWHPSPDKCPAKGVTCFAATRLVTMEVAV